MRKVDKFDPLISSNNNRFKKEVKKRLLTSLGMGGQTSPHFRNSSKNYFTAIPSDS